MTAETVIDWEVTAPQNHMVTNQVEIGDNKNTDEAPTVLSLWRVYLFI